MSFRFMARNFQSSVLRKCGWITMFRGGGGVQPHEQCHLPVANSGCQVAKSVHQNFLDMTWQVNVTWIQQPCPMHEAHSTHRNTVFFRTDRLDFVAKYFVKRKNGYNLLWNWCPLSFQRALSPTDDQLVARVRVSKSVHTSNKLVLGYHQIE